MESKKCTLREATAMVVADGVMMGHELSKSCQTQHLVTWECLCGALCEWRKDLGLIYKKAHSNEPAPMIASTSLSAQVTSTCNYIFEQ
jgi:hypothetical protein